MPWHVAPPSPGDARRPRGGPHRPQSDRLNLAFPGQRIVFVRQAETFHAARNGALD